MPPPYVRNFGQYTVKNVKTFIGREGYGYNCNLYRNKVKIGFCMDDASGGEMDIQWTCSNRTEEERLLREHIASLPSVPSEINNHPLAIDEGIFIEELVNRVEEEKQNRKIQRQCQTKTLFRVSSDRHEMYRIINAPLNENMRAHLQRTHGDRLTEIINDRF